MRRFIILILMSLGIGPLAAAPAVLYPGQNLDGVYLGRYLEICPEPDPAPASFAEIRQHWQKLSCYNKPNDIPELTIGSGSYWFHIHVSHQETSPLPVILEHNWPSDFARIVLVKDDTIVSDSSFGSDVYQTPSILHRYTAQRLTLQPGEQDIYIHLRHTGSVRLPLRLWSEESFQHNKYKEDIATAILVGITLAMMLYNIFLFMTFRFKQQVYYVGYLIATFWYLIFWSGFSQIIPGPWRMLFSKSWIASSSLMCFFLCHFTLQFLDIRGSSRGLTWAFRAFAWGFGFNVILEFIDRKSSFLIFSLFLTPYMLTCIWAGCRGVWRRGRPAIFYLLSFTLVLMGGALENFIALGLADPKWSFWPFFAASNLQSILLSLAMGDKLHLDQKEAHGKILTLNTQLQEHVDHVNDLVNQKTREIRSIMTNLPQGILMIQRDLTIHRDYSDFCSQLFEQQALEGRNALDVIFHKTQLGADRLAQVQAALQSCLGEPELAYQLNVDCFPQECRREARNGSQQILEMDWHPILDPQGNIERFLVSVRDVTSLRSLQTQSHNQMQRLELIGEIINIDHTAFLRFMKSCRAFQSENQRLVENLQVYDPEVNKILFINMHTMKGASRGLQLTKMADLYHKVEQHLADLQMGQADFSQELLLQHIQAINIKLDLYESVSRRDLGRTMQGDEHAIVAMKDLEPFVQRIDTLDLSNKDATKNFVSDVRALFTQLYYQDPGRVFTDIFSGLTQLAKDLAKEVPQVQMNLGQVMITREAEDLFRNIFVHLLRNSMDHGIETAAERIKKGKSVKGQILVEMRCTPDGMEVTYRDDGRGLDLKAIQSAAARQGLIRPQTQPTLKELAEFIFASGFTTSHTLSEISGRGVGMDAVSRYLKDQGGSIHIHLPPQADVSWAFTPFYFVIHLPPRFYRSFSIAA